jgi:adenylate cyclase
MSVTNASDLHGKPQDRRRLVAVVYADMVGYSRLIGLDDAGTLSRLRALRRSLIDPTIEEHGGRIVQTGGDSLLLVFDSIDGAVRCAVKVQQEIPIHDADQPPDQAIRYRIGINLGDAIADGTDLHGDAVNVAARLQAECPPGGICVSRSVRDHVHGRLDLAFEELGSLKLKNIARPVEVFVLRLDVETNPVERSLTNDIRQAPPLPDKPSIAVLAFTNMSDDPDQEYFADGVTEDIITELARSRSLFVIARNSSFAYKGRAVDVKQVGRELGVRYVLEGSVRKVGNGVRVTAQLLEASGGHHLWAERYDRRFEDIFAIQDDITASIAGRLDPEILSAEYARISRKDTPSLNAWECVVRAFYHSSKQSEEESLKALELLDRALLHDSDYAKALGMKAWILVFRAFQGWENMGRVLTLAERLIAHALAINNDELWPYLAHGMVGYATRDNELAMTALERAVDLNPNSVNAHGLLGNAHSFGGRSTEALECLRRAMRLSPRDAFLSDFELYSAFAYFQAANHDLGLKFALQAHRLRPSHPYPLLLGASCAGHVGNAEIGAALLRDLKAILPIVSPAWVEATSPYIRADDRARLVEGLARAGLAANQAT